MMPFTSTIRPGMAALALSALLAGAPGEALAARSAVEVTVGVEHACARLGTGGAACWGTNIAGALGQGFFSTESRFPVDVTGLSGAVLKASAGYYTTCAIVTGGALKCWGDNGAGKLGSNATASSPTPVDVLGMASGVTSVSVGDAHACAVVNGAAKCWGRNEYGQLGDGTLVDRGAPVQVTGLASGVLAVAAGRDHSCAALTNGTVRCWGRGDSGQLGGGTFVTNYPPLPPNPPVAVTGLAGFNVVEITAGAYHSCARSSTGGAKCWGWNGEGQLGVGTRPTSAEATPLDVVGLTSGVTSLSAGQSHTCAVAFGGAKCWGWNVAGQLGTGNAASTIAPANVAGLASGVIQVSAGLAHSCAVKADGTAYCWGSNDFGKLGNATDVASSNSPVLVSIDPTAPGAPTITSLVAGDLQLTITFAPTTTGGREITRFDRTCTAPGFPVHSNFSTALEPTTATIPWPANGVPVTCTVTATNAIGTSPPSAPQTATPVTTPDTPRLLSVTPGAGSLTIAFAPPANGGSPLTGYSARCTNGVDTRTANAAAGATSISVSVAPSTAYRCTVTALNALGAGPESVPWPAVTADAGGLAPVNPSTDIVRFRARPVGAGGPAITLALTNSSAATRTFQLSTTSTEFSVLGCGAPTPLAGPGAVSAALTLTAGSVCTVELRFTPATGGTRSADLFVSVSGWLNARKVRLTGSGTPIAAGFDFTLRLLDTGVVSAFGANDAGQLGNGTTVNLAYPVSAVGLADVVAIAAGSHHAVALRADGTVWTWGRNDRGQLGYPTASACAARRDITRNNIFSEPDPFPCAKTPQAVPGLDRVVAISAGHTITMALRADGSVWSWGNNRLGGLGRTASRVPLDSPGPVNGVGPDIVDLATGGLHTVARRSTGSLAAWGATRLDDGITANLAVLPPIKSIVAGFAHTLALAEDGSVWSWGWGTWGQLGNETGAAFIRSRATPVVVPGASGVVEVAAGWAFSFARRANGTVLAWGYGSSGQLGLPVPPPDTCVPGQDYIGGDPCAKTPLVSPGLAGVVGVYGGGAHTIGLLANGAIVAFGANGAGQRANTTGNFGVIDLLGAFDYANVTYLYHCDDCGTLSSGAPPTPPSLSARSTSGPITVQPLSGFTFSSPVPVGMAAATQLVQVSNTSASQPFAITGVLAAGEFAAAGCGAILAPGDSCAISVGFLPAGQGLRAGAVTLASDVAAFPTLSFDLAGFGTAPPDAPTGLAATAGDGQASIAFQPPANDGGSPVASFTATCSPGALSATGSASPLVVSGLTNAVTYACRVVASSALGSSPPSEAVSVKPLSSQPVVLTVAKAGTGAGSVTSSPPGIDCGTVCSAPFTAGSAVTLAAAPVAGSHFTGWTGDCVGTGSCALVLDAARNVTANFTNQPAAIPRLGNISTRMQVLTGNDVLIGGFVIGGSQPKTVVVRARGPSLIPFGIANALVNPTMQLFSGQTVLAVNDDWGLADNAPAILSSGFAPSNAFESAILTTLAPGAYTAVVSGVGGTTGVGIIEVFEVDLPQVPLLNISTRGVVLTGGDVMIGGFIIMGDAPQTVIVRARGPSLVPFGIANALMDPVLQLLNGQVLLQTNDDWQAGPDTVTIQSAGFAPGDARESVIRITLPPGAYTAIVTGKNGTTGVGIIEVFAQ